MSIKLKKTDFVRNLIKNHKLAGHIDQAIAGGEFKWEARFDPKEGDDGWHPSGDCIPSCTDLYLKAQADMEGEEGRKPSASLMKSFQVGHFWHAYIQHIVVNKLFFAEEDAIERRGTTGWGEKQKPRYFGYGSDHKVVFKPFHYATGAADIAPCTLPGLGDYLVDIKTMKAQDFKQMSLPGWCAPKYECQINIYMDWFDLEQAIILCVCKDSPHEFKEFSFERNQSLIDAIYGKWKLVADCLEIGEIPPEDYQVDLPLVGPKL